MKIGLVKYIVAKDYIITTFRTDNKYSDNIHPDLILFTSPKKDSLRRDFTINGMFYEGKEIIDYVGGV